MTKILENGQLEFLLEEMTFDQLEQTVQLLIKKRNNSTDLDERINFSTLISQILIEMNYKAWEV